MNVGELYVSLGIKGAEKTADTLAGVNKGLKGIASTSFETKAALVGAVYALERLFANSGQVGTNLTNLNTLIGVSTRTIQQYDYAARQVGVSNQEMEGTFVSLQSTMTKTLLGQGTPSGLARLQQVTGQTGAGVLKSWQDHPEELLKVLQRYAQLETSIGRRNSVLQSFGLSNSLIAALGRNAFNDKTLNRAPLYGDKESEALDRLRAGWSNLETTIEMAIGHFNAKHGEQLVTGISEITSSVLHLSEAFATLAEKTKFFHALGAVFDKFTHSVELLTSGITELNGAVSDPKKNAAPFLQDVLTKVPKLGAGTPFQNPALIFFSTLLGKAIGDIGDLSRPSTRGLPSPQPNATAGPTVIQHMQFAHPGVDPKKTGESTEKAIKNGYRQIPAQKQGS